MFYNFSRRDSNSRTLGPPSPQGGWNPPKCLLYWMIPFQLMGPNPDLSSVIWTMVLKPDPMIILGPDRCIIPHVEKVF